MHTVQAWIIILNYIIFDEKLFHEELNIYELQIDITSKKAEFKLGGGSRSAIYELVWLGSIAAVFT